MTSANNQIITRCPKCGTAFRVTPSQLQSAKGAVRCGSCLHVFKAQEYLVATPVAPAKSGIAQPTANAPLPKAELAKIELPKTELSPQSSSAPLVAIKSNAANNNSETKKSSEIPKSIPVNKSTETKTKIEITESASPVKNIAPQAAFVAQPAAVVEQPAILSAIKPLVIDTPTAAVTKPAAKPAPTPTKPVIRTINKSSLGQTDDILISDDMEDEKTDSNNYEFDGFVDIDSTPKSDVSLFERKLRDKDADDEPANTADESWAEMLIEDEDDTPQLGVVKPKTDEQLADDALAASTVEKNHDAVITPSPSNTAPGLVFSLVGEKEEESNQKASDEFVLSEELERIPSNQGFKQPQAAEMLDPNLFETPDESGTDENDNPKRQVKTQPKMRAYDGSRTALLMNIIPAPIEFSAKRMRRWYQRKLWPSLSILGLLALVVQVGWFKFDYFSRVEPYRTGYLFLCPYLGCQVPTLVDTSRIIASNLIVREHPDTQGALAVDVMLINGAPFEQPFPDLVLVFTDINENQVAARRFTPKDYLGGELVGRELMPQNQKIHITLDLVDPGAEAVNYHISIAR